MTKIAKITLQLSADDRAFLIEQGNTEQGLDAFVVQASADGRTQEDFDAQIAEIRANVVRAKAEREAHEAEQAAAERKANRYAFAGMALQGLLAGQIPFGNERNRALDKGEIAKLSVSYADDLLDALDAPASED